MIAHDEFKRLYDEQLLLDEREMHPKAWDAPKAGPGSWSNASGRFAAEWAQLFPEIRRRGLASLSVE